MSWLQLDTGFFGQPAIHEAGVDGALVFLALACRLAERRGATGAIDAREMSGNYLASLVGGLTPKRAERAAKALVTSGAWVVDRRWTRYAPKLWNAMTKELRRWRAAQRRKRAKSKGRPGTVTGSIGEVSTTDPPHPPTDPTDSKEPTPLTDSDQPDSGSGGIETSSTDGGETHEGQGWALAFVDQHLGDRIRKRNDLEAGLRTWLQKCGGPGSRFTYAVKATVADVQGARKSKGGAFLERLDAEPPHPPAPPKRRDHGFIGCDRCDEQLPHPNTSPEAEQLYKAHAETHRQPVDGNGTR